MALSFLSKYKDFGLLILRLGIGGAFLLVHGWPKISGGPEFWVKQGASMGNLGIHFAPMFWGFMSSITEFGGGALLILGLFNRPVAFFMMCNMIVAVTFHLTHLDPWSRVIEAIEMLSVFIALFFTGPGKFSLDNLFFKKS